MSTARWRALARVFTGLGLLLIGAITAMARIPGHHVLALEISAFAAGLIAVAAGMSYLHSTRGPQS